MLTAHELLENNPITYESVIQCEHNVITQLTCIFETKKLCQSLWDQRESVEALAKYHLGLGSKHTCTVLGQHTWIRGGFNVCIPVEVNCGSTSMRVAAVHL
jgi:hypothetical protein